MEILVLLATALLCLATWGLYRLCERLRARP